MQMILSEVVVRIYVAISVATITSDDAEWRGEGVSLAESASCCNQVLWKTFGANLMSADSSTAVFELGSSAAVKFFVVDGLMTSMRVLTHIDMSDEETLAEYDRLMAKSKSTK